MAPKARAARMSLAHLAQPAAAPVRQQASLLTLEVSVDEVQLDGSNGETYKALRAVVAHAGSVAAGAPANYHGLNTLTPRSLACMNLPDVPKGVCEAASGLVPPEANKNPYKSVSWVWLEIAYATKAAYANHASLFVVQKLKSVMEQALFNVNVQVAAVDNKSAWSATAVIEGNRIKITRSGSKIAGGTYTIQELFQVKLRLESTLPPNIKKVLNSLAKTYSAVTTVVEVAQGTAFPKMLAPLLPPPSVATPTTMKVRKAMIQKTAMKLSGCRVVKKTVMKKRVVKK